MLNSSKIINLWLIFFLFFLTSSAQENLSVIKNLSQSADVILAGKVMEKKSNWNAPKTRIYTTATVQVGEYLKGNNNENTVEITYPGGEVGDVGELYTHMPTFKQNEEVLVFLKKDRKSTAFKVLNGEAGKITILEDEKTKEKVTSSNLRIKSLKEQIKGFVNE